MAREFDQLESRRRAQLADPQYLRDLQELGSRGTPPPYQTASLGQRYRQAPTLDEMRPDQAYIRRLFEQEMLRQQGPQPLDYQERFGDPTKRMLQNVPPSLGGTQLAGDVVPLRPGAAPQIPQTGSQGQQSIEAAGGKQSPYLDLMDVLKFPGKRSEAPPVKSPMEALSGVIPSQILDGYMGQPGAVASIAEWSKAYDRLARMGAKPGAVALFRIATRNLGNTLGTKVSAEDFMGGTSG